METPSKRPRLSLFDEDTSGVELDSARHDNDLYLKSRFESIFAKYSQDFTDIGDEVDLLTGEVVVNNGHLESMETETDPGVDRMLGRFGAAGKSMLRAMTVNLDPSLPGPDDVLTSIETIAENVEMADDTSENEDDQMSNDGNDQTSMQPYNSDSDSLFDDTKSVDSLFDTTPQPQTLPSRLDPMATEDEILAKFGPKVGSEVLGLLKHQKQAHIEPAWRIPIIIEPQSTTPQPGQLSSSESPPHNNTQSSPQQSRSIWRSRPKKRAESVDPLQEDFSSDKESGPDPDQALMAQITATGECPYCKVHFTNKSGVMAHWDRLLRNGIPEDDSHDGELMAQIRQSAKRRVRLPRLVVYDLRTMVELHEGAGMTFNEIAESKALRSRKNGLRLQDMYNKHRTPLDSNDTPPWTDEENNILEEMCKNPLTTIATIRRSLKGRDDVDIGNHLAETWLAQLGVLRGKTDEPQIKEERSEDDLFD